MKYLPVIMMLMLASCGNDTRQAGEGNTDTIQIREVPVADTAEISIDSSKFTTVQWLDSLADFGTVKEGERIEVQFRFRNTGKQPLIIQGVSAACGCTVPEYSKAPVMPGKDGFVKAVFNSMGQPPTVHKNVTVTMNTFGKQYHTLAFIGEVQK